MRRLPRPPLLTEEEETSDEPPASEAASEPDPLITSLCSSALLSLYAPAVPRVSRADQGAKALPNKYHHELMVRLAPEPADDFVAKWSLVTSSFVCQVPIVNIISAIDSF